MFYGRKEELRQLRGLKQKKTASLVCVLGRRRVGKSSLIEHFAQSSKNFIQIQGVAPVDVGRGGAQVQLNHFSSSLRKIFGGPQIQFQNWGEALEEMAMKTRRGEYIILLDEVSWMATGEPLFGSYLKDTWDRLFKKNPKLILVICGSVSTWIQSNILHHTNFVGRISLAIHLKELKLNEIDHFFHHKNQKVSSFEKLMYLGVTGGIPKYLEEINHSETINQNLARLCFTPSGFLFQDFDRIFNDIFGRKRKSLENIVMKLIEAPLTIAQIAKKLSRAQNSDLSEDLKILEISGFIERDYYFKINGGISKLSQYRMSDNYLRFYLKYIYPIKSKAIGSQPVMKSISDLKNYEALLGYQFVSLIYNNKDLVFSLLGLELSHIVSVGPYFQKKNSNNKGSCQIDLLIQDRLNSFYLCELKCQKMIDRTVVKEVERKVKILALPRRSSLRTVLIYEGELYPPHAEEIKNSFFKILRLEQFLQHPEFI